MTAPIRFTATLHRPKSQGAAKPPAWTFLTLPPAASAKLPSRGMVSIHGTFNTIPFAATLNPDNRGGHWLKVDKKLRLAANAHPGDTVSLEIAPVTQEPEPQVPPDLRKALAAAPAKSQSVWSDITPRARRDWIQWLDSAKQQQTRAKRIAAACDMLAHGKRRPCCFDRSGLASKALPCPLPEETTPPR